MATNASNVRVGVTGAAYHAPLGTTVPTDAKTAPAATFKEVGYISEDGVVQSISTDTSDIKAWQNGDIVRKVQTSHDITFQFSMLETTKDSTGLYYADPDASDTKVTVTGKQSVHEAWVLDVKDGKDNVRIVIPDGQVTERGDITWSGSDAIMYDVTISAFPVNGVKATIYHDVDSPTDEDGIVEQIVSPEVDDVEEAEADDVEQAEAEEAETEEPDAA